MTDLVLTSDDLATFLGSAVDADRATQLIAWVMDEAKSFVNPVPSTAASVVLQAVTRIYTNPSGVTQELVGPYQATKAGGALFNKGERAALLRLSGSGGAYSFDLLDINGVGDDTDYPASRFPTS